MTRQAAAYRAGRVLLAGDSAHVHYPAGGQDERHPVAARALQHTMAQTALQRRDERIQALVDVVSELASMDEPRKRLAGSISGLDIHTTSARAIRCSDAGCPIWTS